MKVVIAPDKFRGSLTAGQAAEAIAAGVRQSCPDADLHVVPVADGATARWTRRCAQATAPSL